MRGLLCQTTGRIASVAAWGAQADNMVWLKNFLMASVGAVAVLGTLAACAPLATLNVMAAAGAHTRVVDVSYGALPRQRLDIYRPSGQPPAGGWPVVVFFNGGSWN
jgi:acetyl esterase/lipase